ncbi:tryptophan-rich sensory protein [Monoraphidium neglectum]|uniref:Tryptophan-rich sensory protein n=1 Tax=Monoraphidium neglectum TaxID=145388 RepID=A0A0D2J4B0_9CHLO|nr:tryptophan-rich sensory protein [Monoraphidium neglectum]KIY94757.1 tryptophan-rich sensory protein [Monoraphidium neglectum]|eukprot:XP_013893777.1 tryptophan-rich sensory protein [Monoraphidium neglectum]
MGVPLALGTVVGTSTLPPIVSWYRKLKKPKWTPPAPLFGQIWSVLYGCMGAASYLVWKRTGFPSAPLGLYGVQLVFNLAWQLIFFQAKKPGVAQAENAVLLGLVAATTVSFARIDANAGKLMAPYLAFTAFANALNWSIWNENPEAASPGDIEPPSKKEL